MELIIVLLPFAALLGLGWLAAYLWSVSSGQFDDLETPAVRILFDDEESPIERPENNVKNPESSK